MKFMDNFLFKKINKTLRIVILTKKTTCMEFIAQNILIFSHKDKKKKEYCMWNS